jgi:hypothetical protein
MHELSGSPASARFTRVSTQQYLRIAFGLVCFLLLASNVTSISHWSERRGVYDDLCYLRQAHLFERFGLSGLDTDITHDDDHFFTEAATAIRHLAWSDPASPAPFCHTFIPATGKRVIQYPPGTGFLLALFPDGFQTIGLFISANVIIFLVSLVAIGRARSASAILLCGGFGFAALYFMINPTKASYSMAPTMVACAVTGLLTASLFSLQSVKGRLLMTLAIGLLIGLSVNFRLPNLFLSGGYFVVFGISFLSSRTLGSFLQGSLLGLGVLVGMAPTLIANAINAGSPFSTTYGAQDTMPPDFTFSSVSMYLSDIQGILIILAIVWVCRDLIAASSRAAKNVAFVTAANLLINLAYFLTHPIAVVYYIMPIAMLSLWSLLFSFLMQEREPLLNASLEPA